MAQPVQLGVVEELGEDCLTCITYCVSHLGQLGKGYLMVWQEDWDHAEPFLISHFYHVSTFLREEIPLGHLSISDNIYL